jgi:hypothetical protein
MADTATLEIAAKTGTKPVKVFRAGRLSATVFKNSATVRDREVTFFNTYLQRTYKDGEAFKTANSLGTEDLLPAQQLLSQAWAWVVEEEAKLRQKAKA